jgi:hypothetical protein
LISSPKRYVAEWEGWWRALWAAARASAAAGRTRPAGGLGGCPRPACGLRSPAAQDDGAQAALGRRSLACCLDREMRNQNTSLLIVKICGFEYALERRAMHRFGRFSTLMKWPFDFVCISGSGFGTSKLGKVGIIMSRIVSFLHRKGQFNLPTVGNLRLFRMTLRSHVCVALKKQ